jgi:hypothetical protein
MQNPAFSLKYFKKKKERKRKEKRKKAVYRAVLSKFDLAFITRK